MKRKQTIGKIKEFGCPFIKILDPSSNKMGFIGIKAILFLE